MAGLVLNPAHDINEEQIAKSSLVAVGIAHYDYLLGAALFKKRVQL